ncbi:MAG: GAF domain-containing protein [Chloroflexi bacterium]|nr:GAF domain-containing protein [Chloroflexota bacterium]
MKKLLSSLQVRLLLLVLLALLPVFGLAFYDRYAQRQQSARAAQARALEIARRAVIDQRELIGAAHQLLLPLAQLQAAREPDPIPCSVLFTELLKHSAIYSNLGLIDAQGEVVCAAVMPSQPLNLRARPYFARVLQSANVALGDFEIGVIADAPAINIALPVVDDTSHVQGAVFASLNQTWLRGFADAQKMPPESVLVLVERDNALGIRYPDWRVLAMRALASDQIARWASASDDQRIAEIPDADGVTRLYTFAPLSLEGYLGVGIPVHLVYADIDQLARRDVTLLILVTILALSAAWLYGDWFIARRVRAMLRATRQIAAGDLSARTEQIYGASELSELARTFDQMAATLQQRAAEQKNAVEALRQQAEEFAAITQLSRQVTSVSDLTQVLSVIARTTTELAQTDAGGVYVPDASGIFRLAVGHGVSAAFIASVNTVGIRPGEGALGRAVVERQPIQVPDISTDSEYASSAFIRTEGIRAILAVPMLRDDHITGGIVLWHRQPRHFAPSEIAFLQAVAQQCVNAIENARLLTETETRANHFAALSETAREIAVQQDLPTLLETIVARAIRLLGVAHGALFLYDAHRRDLELVVQRGQSVDVPLGSRWQLGEGVAGRVAQTQQPLIINDYRHWEHRSAQMEQIPVTAVMQVPLLHRGELIGVLSVTELGETTRQFTDEETRLLTLFAGQVAAAVHNTRLLQETRARAEQLTLVYDAGLALNSILEPSAQLEYLLKIVQRVLKADCVLFFQFDPARGALDPAFCLGYDAEQQARWRALHSSVNDETTIPGWVATHRLPLNLPEMSADPRYVAINPRMCSGLWTPIEREQNLLGVLGVLSAQANAFAPEAERTLALFANQAAIALENARLFDEAQASLLILTRLYNLSSQMLTATTVQAIAELAPQILRDSFAADTVWLHLVDPQGEREFTHCVGIDSAEYARLVPRADGLAAQLWRTQKPTVIDDPQGLHPLSRARGVKTNVALPLLSQPVNLGVFFLEYRTTRPFSEREINLLSLFANQVALAIKRVRLTSETQHRADQLAILNRLASALNQPARLDDLLQVIYREITTALSCDAFFIALRDPTTNELDYRIQVDEGVVEKPQRRPLRTGLSYHGAHLPIGGGLGCKQGIEAPIDPSEP